MEIMIKQFIQYSQKKLDNYTIKKKLYLLYIFCVLIPLIITDSIILSIVIQTEKAARKHDMENTANAVKYNISLSIEQAETFAKNIYLNHDINEFMNVQYKSPLDYYNGYLKLMKDSLFKSSLGTSNMVITMYADNPTIINGSEFSRLEMIKESEWYQYLQQSEQDIICYIYYEDKINTESRRKISVIRKLNFYKKDTFEKILKVDLDYSQMTRSLINANYDNPVYICMDDRIIFSNDGHSGLIKNFDTFSKEEKKQIGYHQSMSIYGTQLDIYILNIKLHILQQLKENLLLILFLIFVNAFFPFLMMQGINHSFTIRFRQISEAFEQVKEEKLQEIKQISGTDEIAVLMHNYNKMVIRINELIQTVYKDKLKKQEMDIARKNAELLALHSQINPHFLFNALESIRMRSILKKEYETAKMVEKLAIMERQNVEWGNDIVTIEEEINFVKAYLELQKYRFGERLSYFIEVEESCQTIQIPRLTLVTFVENACVHGIENKIAKSWIFVRVYKNEDWIFLEIEDTGGGIKPYIAEELKEKMEQASIEQLKKKGRVGIVNACLRLKMVTDDKVKFDLESEENIGTIVTIKIPKEREES